MTDLSSLQKEIQEKLTQVHDPKVLEELRVEYLGRKGKIADLFKNIATLPNEEKRQFGQALNQLKEFAEQAFSEKTASLENQGAKTDQSFDPTLPGVSTKLGKLHPITRTIREISDIFRINLL